MTGYSIVIPTTGRDNLHALLDDLRQGENPLLKEIIVVDDRPKAPQRARELRVEGARVLVSGGRGPAAARNTGWLAAATEWIAFLDDDVRVSPRWHADLVADIADQPADVGASQAEITVPLSEDRKPTDDERGTAALAKARWITADMAYRREALLAVGGFDERFPRAYREDADLALRVREAGYRIVRGQRVTVHPARQAGPLASLRAQRGNADNALMRRKHGRAWRRKVGEGPGRLGRHALTTISGVTALAALTARRRPVALAAAAAWTVLTAEFAARRIAPGPKTAGEIGRMLLTSVLIPPAACAHRIAGEAKARRTKPPGQPVPPAAILFDRDDTLIVDVPYLGDPERVRPVPGAEEILTLLRKAGIPVGVVSNQSGVSRGLITEQDVEAVNAKVEQVLGPFGTWQVCVHGDDDRCSCRKPAPGLILRAAEALGVQVRECVVIGDTGADVDAAEAAGAVGILVPTARTLPEEVERARLVAPNLREAVRLAGVR
ncbi:HAD-IIIA family hydrolase [Amycolatopsis pigmentata]|uniref:D,D-heptose 1,7-bisphosphate phosphatase n=1 Tax=Amycolatopsis pigmentata TaxID=450801 RepID=A0ABW5FYC0_9PSEU